MGAVRHAVIVVEHADCRLGKPTNARRSEILHANDEAGLLLQLAFRATWLCQQDLRSLETHGLDRRDHRDGGSDCQSGGGGGKRHCRVDSESFYRGGNDRRRGRDRNRRHQGGGDRLCDGDSDRRRLDGRSRFSLR